MRRYELVPVIGAGTQTDPIRANVTGPHVVVAYRTARCLIKRPVPDGTAVTPGTVADMPTRGRHVTPAPLDATERATIKTYLTAQGLDVTNFDGDGVTDRRQYLRFILRRALLAPEHDGPAALSGFDVAG